MRMSSRVYMMRILTERILQSLQVNKAYKNKSTSFYRASQSQASWCWLWYSFGSNSIKAHNEVYRNDLATDLDAVRSIGNAATSTGRFLIRPSVGSATNAIKDVGSGIENALTVPDSPSSSSRSAVDNLLGPNDGLKMESQ